MPDGVRPIYCKDCLSISKTEKKREAEERLKKKQEELGIVAVLPDDNKKDRDGISLQDAVKQGVVKF